MYLHALRCFYFFWNVRMYSQAHIVREYLFRLSKKSTKLIFNNSNSRTQNTIHKSKRYYIFVTVVLHRYISFPMRKCNCQFLLCFSFSTVSNLNSDDPFSIVCTRIALLQFTRVVYLYTTGECSRIEITLVRRSYGFSI